MSSKNQLHYFYDKEADVFYLSKGKPSARDISEEIDDGIVARFDPKTKKVRGLTIISFAARSKKKAETVNLPFEINFSPTSL